MVPENSSDSHLRDVVVGGLMPYSDIDDLDFVPVLSGPRISSTNPDPKKFYGPVTIRNYIAGHKKKSLRLLRAKGTSESAIFLKIPIELQLQVLEHLHPLDLYHFSQVSKSLRKIVLHPKSLGVWKTAFHRHPELPSPPPRIKESDWTFMIYGPGICGVCGKYGALTDFNFLRRLCEPCLKDHCLPINSFSDEWNNGISQHHEVWSLIPKSNRLNGVRYNTFVTERFLKADFYTMWKKLRLIHILVDNHVPLISDLFEEYKTELKYHVYTHRVSATIATNWAKDVLRRFSDDYDNRTFMLTNRCENRLQALGHDQVDISAAIVPMRYVFCDESVYRLTRKAFRKVKPKLEALVRIAKNNRIESERQMLLMGIYEDYLKARRPDDWQYLPHPEVGYIIQIDGFNHFLNAPFEKRGDISPGDATPIFSDFLEKWLKTQQEHILSILPAVEGKEETFDAKVRRLELAKSVVTCKDCSGFSDSGLALVGWNNVCRHLCSKPGGFIDSCRRYVVIPRMVTSAISLVSCVGLDSSTTTVTDMNHREDRFMCGSCMPMHHRGRRFLRVYTWLECLQHTAKMLSDTLHSTPTWFLLTPNATRFVREHERPYPHPLHYIWRCNHCAQHFEIQAVQAEAVTHVKRVHCIKDPVIGKDVVPDLRQKIRRRQPFRLYRDPAFQYKCKACVDLPIFQLWESSALLLHLLTKHHINTPVENVHWEAVVIIAASAASVST